MAGAQGGPGGDMRNDVVEERDGDPPDLERGSQEAARSQLSERREGYAPVGGRGRRRHTDGSSAPPSPLGWWDGGTAPRGGMKVRRTWQSYVD